MGEYVLLNGESTKLGTCESLYYTTFEQLQKAVHRMRFEGGNLQPRQYLDAKHGWLYRFPFPDEDDIPIGTHENFDRGVKITVPKDSPVVLDEDGHSDICVRVDPVNVFVPCLASDKIKSIKTSPLPNYAIIEITQQKQVDGELWTVVRCGWCKSAYRLPYDEAKWLADYISSEEFTKYANAKFFQTIADRMMSGYKTPCPTDDSR